MKPRLSQIRPEGVAGTYPKVNATADGWDYSAVVGGGFDRAAGMPPRLVPPNVKLRGGNIVPQDSVGNPWKTLYANWAAKWPTIVKPQIDAAASAGANAIRLIGDVDGVHNGVLTLDAYVAAYEQFVDYCANLGIWVYATLSGATSWGGATKDQALVIMEAQAAMLDSKPNVFGVDVVQEIGLSPSLYTGMTLHDFVAYLFTGLRGVTTLPLTCSVLGSSNSSAAQWSTTTTTDLADVVDFYDFHPYYDGMVASDLGPFFALTDKPLIIGEYGADITKPARYSAAADVSDLDGVVGSFVWAITDNETAPSGQGGLFDFTFVERTNLTTYFKTVPDHQGTLPETSPIIRGNGVIMPSRARLDLSDAFTVTDDLANDATSVDINFPTVVTAELLMQDGVTSPPVPLETEDGSDWLYQDV